LAEVEKRLLLLSWPCAGVGWGRERRRSVVYRWGMRVRRGDGSILAIGVKVTMRFDGRERKRRRSVGGRRRCGATAAVQDEARHGDGASSPAASPAQRRRNTSSFFFFFFFCFFFFGFVFFPPVAILHFACIYVCMCVRITGRTLEKWRTFSGWSRNRRRRISFR
jgi:hypothetical protein